MQGPLVAGSQIDAIWLSANLRGKLQSCSSCPAHTSPGIGFAERTGWWRSRKGASDVWVDAGDFLVGPDSLSDGGVGMVAALNHVGLLAAHVTVADLWQGRDTTIEVLDTAQFSTFSTNLAHPETGERLFDPFLVIPSESPLVILGVSAIPRTHQTSVLVQPPPEALDLAAREALALHPNARFVICLAGHWAKPLELPASLVGRVHASISGSRTNGLAQSTDVSSHHFIGEHGEQMVRGEVGSQSVWGALEVDRSFLPDAGVEAVLAAQTDWLDLMAMDASESGSGSTPIQARNQGFQVSLLGQSRHEVWEGRQAPKGHEWLALRLEWENKLDRSLRKELGYPDAVQIAFPEKQALLLVDGWRLTRPFEANAVGWNRDISKIFLGEPLEFEERTFVYAIPTSTSEEWVLRVYHEQFETLVVSPGEADPERTPDKQEAKPGWEIATGEVHPFAANARLESRLENVRKEVEFGEDEVLWEAEWFGRSALKESVDTLALNADGRLGETALHGQLSEYFMAWQMLALVDESGAHYYAEPPVQEDRDLLFVPDVWTGVPLRFVLPKDSQPAYLWAPWTGVRTPGAEQVEFPKALRFGLSESGEENVGPDPLHVFGGDPLRGQLHGGQVDGHRLRLQMAIGNTGPTGGFVNPLKRFTLRANDGAVMAGSLLSPNSVPAGGAVWVEAGGRPHPVEAVFNVPPLIQSATLSFQAPDAARSIALDWSSGLLKLQETVKPSGPGAQDPSDGSKAEGEPVATEPGPSAESDEVASPGQGPDVLPGGEAPTHVETVQKEASDQARPEAKGLAGVGLKAHQIQAAIDRGADFLWEHLKVDLLRGSLEHFGATNPNHTLISLALVHAGLHERSDEFREALHLAIPRMEGFVDQTYPASVICMLLDALGDPQYMPLMERAAKSLIESQGPEGTWLYGCKWEGDVRPSSGGESFVTVFESNGIRMVRESPWAEGPLDGDNSVIQFALLGLRAAQRQGLRIPEETWRLSEDRILKRTGDDGSLGYKTEKGYGSMTCAGIGSVAIARWGLGSQVDLLDPSMQVPLSWLGRHFSVSEHPGKRTFHYYYLYSLERVGRLLDVDFFGEHEWFPLGAKYLLKNQDSTGSWVEQGAHAKPTCFALLFLTQATESLAEAPLEKTVGTLALEAVEREDAAVYWIVDASGSMRGKVEGRSKFDWAQDALMELAAALPEGKAVGLRAYGHRLRANVKEADRDSELLLPLEPWSVAHRGEFEEIVQRLQPRGKTPMAYSLEEALKDLGKHQNGMLILLTDGGEDTRERRNPVLVAEKIAKRRGWGLVVVGLDIEKERWNTQLQAMADAAGGLYLDAKNGTSLLPLLQAAVSPLPKEIRLESIRDPGGAVDPGGGQMLTLPSDIPLDAGEYRLRFSVGGEEFLVPVTIRNGFKTRVRLDPARFQTTNSSR